MSECRADSQREVFLRKLIHDHMAFCDMFQGQADAEFLRDADRGKDIVCLVGMGL